MDFDNVTPIRPDYNQPNYDRAKIAPFTLEDPLTFVDGTKVKTPADWARRRREILDIFATEMYGQEPPKPQVLVTELVDRKEDAMAGFAVREQYRMWFTADKSGPCVTWLLVRPRYAEKPVPVILFLNYRGNHELLPDTDIPVQSCWCRNDNFVNNNHSSEATRGLLNNPNNDTFLPISTIIARGYALMSACYCEVSPDPNFWNPEDRKKNEQQAYTGVFDLWGKRDNSRTDNTTSLGAWAWSLSRGLDLVERIPELDAKKAVVTGCSRLGKSALLAAARDERFAVCVPNQCGGGGVCAAKRDFGENVGTEVERFPHWYCKAYNKYAKNPPALLHFDQHLLVASIAPRPILVEGYNHDDWMDSEGEYISCRAVAPVWDFFGLGGMPGNCYPKPYSMSTVGPHFGFVLRTEKHGLSAIDWQWLLDFADKQLK